MPTITQENLYLILGVSVGFLTIFICVALIYLILVLRDASKILDKTRDTVEKINMIVVKPVKLVATIVEHVRPMVYKALEGVRKRANARKGK